MLLSVGLIFNLSLAVAGQTELLSDHYKYLKNASRTCRSLLSSLAGFLSTMSEKEPPSYSDNRVDDNGHEYEGLDIDDNLPGYEESQQTTRKPIKTKDFLSTIENRGKAWALLTLTANEHLSKNIPTFLEGSPVKGTVKLSLDRPEYIYSVYISVCPLHETN